MQLDLSKYRQHIAQRLTANAYHQAQIDEKIANGENIEGGKIKMPKFLKDVGNEIVKDVKSTAKTAGKEMLKQGVNNLKNDIKQGVMNSAVEGGKMEYMDDIKKSADKMEEVKGGKFSLGKVFKSVGNDIKKGANEIKNTAIKTGAQKLGKEAGEYVYNGVKEAGKKFMEATPEMEMGAEEAGMTVAENPELLMVAAGMEKPKKRTRTVTDEQKRRSAKVRELMHKHGISLPEASKYIKQNNIKY